MGIGVIIGTYFLFQNTDTSTDVTSETITSRQAPITEKMRATNKSTTQHHATFNTNTSSLTTTTHSDNTKQSVASAQPTNSNNQSNKSITETVNPVQYSTGSISSDNDSYINKNNQLKTSTPYESEINASMVAQSKNKSLNGNEWLAHNTDATLLDNDNTDLNQEHINTTSNNLQPNHIKWLVDKNVQGQEEWLVFESLNYLSPNQTLPHPSLAPVNTINIPTTLITTKKRKVSKELLFGMSGGILSLGKVNAYLSPSVEYRINRFGFYGGAFYNINDVRKITSGEGANESTVNVITSSTIQHRISAIIGANYSIWSSNKQQLLLNGGLISKSFTLNGNVGSSLPFLLDGGLEFRRSVFKKYQAGIYYNFLYAASGESQTGHQVGIRLLFGGKRKRK
jgi:hypothetical protein